MKEYDLISIGTGSAIHIVDAMLQRVPNLKVAIIDKDEPGGICLTRGCIPSKLLLYPAEMVRTIERANEFGIDVRLQKIDFNKVMESMRYHINNEINMIRNGLSKSQNIDYYHDVVEFIEPYSLKVGNSSNNVMITAKMILLCIGSKPTIPPIKGLDGVGYHTSDTILALNQLPESIAIVGGGYIGAEYGHFFSSMGSKVSIVSRNKQFLHEEEPEISALAKRELGKHMEIITNYEVIEVSEEEEEEVTYRTNKEDNMKEGERKKKKSLTIQDQSNGERRKITAQEVLIAAGRGSNTDILHPERAGIKTDQNGWILVDEYLETSQPNIWAFGDANGIYLFKHKANYEAQLVYINAVLKAEEKNHKKKVKKDYHAVPHAVFTYPEIAAVGLGEREALAKYGENNILIGVARFEDTAKGIAMGIKDHFVKVIAKPEEDDLGIIGAHIIGPYASILIQEIINIMYTQHERTVKPILSAMHIHPSLSEVVQRSVSSFMPPKQYHHMISEHYGLSIE